VANPNNLLGIKEYSGPPAPKPGPRPGETQPKDKLADGEAPKQESAVLAPWPLIDKYPTIVGSNLSLTYLSSVYRLALTGYRREYVDALNEILERDPTAFALINQRVLTVAGCRIEFTPSDKDNRRARKICDEVRTRFRRIVDLQQSIATLLFSGLYYGVGACETAWDNSDGWSPTRLHFIHSRRLNYPDPATWALHIWDQGQVGPYDQNWATSKTSQSLFGIRAKDYPGKFVTHTPQLRADYPVREGLGRQIAMWSALKGMGARGAAQFVERYAKPWATATYTTKSDGVPRAADENDISAADNALRALGTGSLAGATIPDSIKILIDQVKSAHNITHSEWIDLCNREEAKAILGQSDTTESGKGGSMARAAVSKSGSDQLARFDAFALASTFQRDIVDWIVRLNYPSDFDKRPTITVVVDAEPDPSTIMDLAAKAAANGMPVDADVLAEKLGLVLAPPDDPPPLNPNNPNPVVTPKDQARILVPLSPTATSAHYPSRYKAAPVPDMSGGDGSSDGSDPDAKDPKKSDPAKNPPRDRKDAKATPNQRPARKDQSAK
jgi:phage gp29-like protein